MITASEVKLRNGTVAVAWPIAATPVPPIAPFELQGFDAHGNPQLWQRDGRWHEHGRPHPLDIVGGVAFEPPTDQDTASGLYD